MVNFPEINGPFSRNKWSIFRPFILDQYQKIVYRCYGALPMFFNLVVPGRAEPRSDLSQGVSLDVGVLGRGKLFSFPILSEGVLGRGVSLDMGGGIIIIL